MPSKPSSANKRKRRGQCKPKPWTKPCSSANRRQGRGQCKVNCKKHVSSSSYDMHVSSSSSNDRSAQDQVQKAKSGNTSQKSAYRESQFQKSMYPPPHMTCAQSWSCVTSCDKWPWAGSRWHTYMPTYIRLYTYMPTYIRMCIPAYIRIRIHVCKYIHTHIQSYSSWPSTMSGRSVRSWRRSNYFTCKSNKWKRRWSFGLRIFHLDYIYLAL